MKLAYRRQVQIIYVFFMNTNSYSFTPNFAVTPEIIMSNLRIFNKKSQEKFLGIFQKQAKNLL